MNNIIKRNKVKRFEIQLRVVVLILPGFEVALFQYCEMEVSLWKFIHVYSQRFYVRWKYHA